MVAQIQNSDRDNTQKEPGDKKMEQTREKQEPILEHAEQVPAQAHTSELGDEPVAAEAVSEESSASRVVTPSADGQSVKKPWTRRLWGARDREALGQETSGPEPADESLSAYVREFTREETSTLDDELFTTQHVRGLSREEVTRDRIEMLHLMREELDQLREETTHAREEMLVSIRGELGQARDTAVVDAQIALAREREREQLAVLGDVQETAQESYTARAALVRLEIEALQEAEQRTLRDREMPLRERMEQVDFIRERLIRAQQEILQVEEAAAQHVASVAQRVSELEGRDSLADLSQKVEHVLKLVPELVQQEVTATLPRRKGGGPSVWIAAVVLLLVAGLGIVGIFLPQSGGSMSMIASSVGDLSIHLAAVYEANGNAAQAIALLDQAVMADFDDPAPLARAADIYSSLGEPEKASETLERALEKQPENKELRLSLAYAYTAAGHASQAADIYETLLKDDPSSADAYHGRLAQLYQGTKSYAKALEHYRNVLDEGGPRAETLQEMGEIYWIQEDTDTALALFQEVLQLNPSNYHALLRTGNYHQENGDCPRAAYYYEQAITVVPDGSWAYYGMGECDLVLEQYADAVVQFELALTYSEFAEFHIGVGNAYLAQDDCAQAVPAFEKALTLWPEMPAAQEGLGQCQE